MGTSHQLGNRYCAGLLLTFVYIWRCNSILLYIHIREYYVVLRNHYVMLYQGYDWLRNDLKLKVSEIRDEVM